MRLIRFMFISLSVCDLVCVRLIKVLVSFSVCDDSCLMCVSSVL